MGGSKSKPSPPRPPPSPKLLDKPWRTINWGDNKDALQFVKDYKPETEGQHIRILLHGPVGTGKSSFINSVQSVLHGRIYIQALADNISKTSFTKQYTTYRIPQRNRSAYYPFVFNDIMGLEETKGVCADDVKLALNGHVREGYKFNPVSKLSAGDHFYNEAPTNNDKVHVLVCVVSANAVGRMSDGVLDMIRDIRMEASRLGIPQVALLTKIDEASPEINRDLKNVYKDKCLKKKLEQFSADVGIPMNCIFPVKNYHNEVDLNDDIDSLTLSSLKKIITFADDYIQFKKSSE